MAIIKRSTTTIVGLDTVVSDLNANIAAEALARSTADGVLSTLTTTAKTNLVGAINEVKGALDTEVTSRKAGQFTPITWNPVRSYHWSTGSNTWEWYDGYSTQVGVLSDVIAELVSQIHGAHNDAKQAHDYLNTRINNVLSNVDATALNSLAEIVTAFQTADQTLNGAITTLAANSSAAITAEQTARTAADTEIKNALVAYSVSTNSAKSALITKLAEYLETASKYTDIVTATSTSAVLDSSNSSKVLVTFISTGNTAPQTSTSILLNFKSIRTTIDGQSYDIEVEGIDAPNSPSNGIGYYDYILTLAFSSASEAASFVGKTFIAQYTMPKAKFTYQQLLDNFDALSGIRYSTFNTSSTPWGALVPFSSY